MFFTYHTTLLTCNEPQVETRMSLFRGRFKASAVSKVIAYYNLNPSSPDKNAVLVGKLLANKRYIYLGLKISYRVFFSHSCR